VTPLLVFAALAGLSLLVGTVLHHRREMLRIKVWSGLDTDDYRKGLRAGILQAADIVHGCSYTYTWERTNAENAIRGASKALEGQR
jgi:hypothetical protein